MVTKVGIRVFDRGEKTSLRMASSSAKMLLPPSIDIQELSGGGRCLCRTSDAADFASRGDGKFKSGTAVDMHVFRGSHECDARETVGVLR